MEINVVNKSRTKINIFHIKKIVERFLNLHKIKLDVSVIFIGDRKMQRINNLYRGKNKTTDVLSFEGDQEYFGDIFINYQQIKRQSPFYSKKIKEELIFILIHGLLHLLGHNDKTEKARVKMIKLGEDVIKKINKKND